MTDTKSPPTPEHMAGIMLMLERAKLALAQAERRKARGTLARGEWQAAQRAAEAAYLTAVDVGAIPAGKMGAAR
jgi:hypothetical protein